MSRPRILGGSAPTQDRARKARARAPSAAVDSRRGGPVPSRPRGDRSWLWVAVPLGVYAVWAVLGAELFVVLTIKSALLADLWELNRGILGLAPTLLLGGAAAGLVGTLAALLLTAGDAPWRRAAWSLLVALSLAGVVTSATTGRLFEEPARRVTVVLGTLVVGWAIAHRVAPRLQDLVVRHPWRVIAGAGATILGLEVVNRFVLYRLYPEWHWALGGLTVLVAPWIVAPVCLSAASRRVPPLERRVRIAITALFVLIVSGAGVGLKSAAVLLSRFDNFRLLLAEQAPLGGAGVRLAGLIAPPPPFLDAECPGSECTVEIASGSESAAISWRDRDLLLVTVDAVRADHVGSYGYERSTTPNIDRLAASGVRFEHAYAATPHTSYSIISMMTGKYMRPLLMQGAGADSDTWAKLLRTYGYRTAAFYPPAVFFIDSRRFEGFSARYLDFEYRKVEFLEGPGRVQQVSGFIAGEAPGRPLFIWVHLFGPHEPYEAHPKHPFGVRDVDRYDSEIAAADETIGQIVGLFRARRPNGVVLLAADHGEEFGDHGGRYHGTSVYEEQVRVPLVINDPRLPPRVVTEPVQTIDLLPTVLAALRIPRSARLRGRELTHLLAGTGEEGEGMAFAETEDQSMIAEGPFRLLCQRQLGACQLFDVLQDPTQATDVSLKWPDKVESLKKRLRHLAASHGRYERSGMRAEGRGWPEPILRAVAGDGDAITDLIPLLDDADVQIRRKAAELAFELRRSDAAPALRLSLTREEDPEVRRWTALALTRFGEGAPLAYDLFSDGDLRWRRLAALALAEVGDRRGAAILVDWWRDEAQRDYERSRQLLAAIGKTRTKDAVWPLLQSLGDVRLRPYIAKALAEIGDDGARGALAKALATERYQSSRVAITEALVALGAETELVRPLVRFLGVPDALPGGVGFAAEAKLLEYVGGPTPKQLERLRTESSLGVLLRVVVPPGGNGTGIRLLIRAKAWPPSDGSVRVGLPTAAFRNSMNTKRVTSRKLPEIDQERQIELRFPVDSQVHELSVTAPTSFELAPRRSVELVVVADRFVSVEGLVAVPLADELPPPAPVPWDPASAGQASLDGIEGAEQPER